LREFRNEEKPLILFPELPGSLSEIISLNDLFIKSKIKPFMFVNKDASETNLKMISSPSLLHIATHSFTSLPNQGDPFMGVLDEFRFGDPMLFNALALSGVNDFNFWENDLENENDYVSALELSLINLKDTYLAVLSSCESGSGISGIGEGISGFKEALFRAGAQNVILSKHTVSDKVTRDFFVLFYQNLLENSDSVHDVLRKTKLQFMSNHNHPYYWNAFVHY
jgi:CHAT domain-containing protein